MLDAERGELPPLLRVAAAGEVRRHHEQLERLERPPHLLVDEAERLVRVRHAGREPHDLEQHRDRLLELAVGEVDVRLPEHALDALPLRHASESAGSAAPVNEARSARSGAQFRVVTHGR